MVGVVDYSHYAAAGELYLLENEISNSLQVYNFNKELLIKTQFKFNAPKSLCYEELNNRLYVNDGPVIQVFLVSGFTELKLIHPIEIADEFLRIVIAHGYLYCLNTREGRLKVLELKPPQK